MSTDERHYLTLCIVGACFWVILFSVAQHAKMPDADTYCNPNVTNPPMPACMEPASTS